MPITMQPTLARTLALCVALFAAANPPVAAGPRDDEAATSARPSLTAGQESYARKRAPVGQRAVPTERYAAALAHMRKMRVYSTASGAFKAGAGEPAAEGVEDLSADALAAVGTWTSLGPGNVGGRTRALVIDPTPPGTTWYAAGVAGGVWKTTNAGSSWTPIGDSLANLAVSSLALRPGFPATILAGTGEGYFNEDQVRGAGIFKTEDGGGTWTQLAATGNSSFHYVNDIVWSPITGKIYAATGSGVFSSPDGGATWAPILTPGLNGGCLDLALRPDGAQDWLLASCGTLTFTQAKVYLTVAAEAATGNASWSVVLTEPLMGRTSLAFGAPSSGIVYAMAANNTTDALHAVFRSADGGQTWTKRASSESPAFTDRILLSNPIFKICLDEEGAVGWYANTIAVDPSDATGNTVWAGGVDLFRSTNGGLNWSPVSSWWQTTEPHFVPGNQHAIVFPPGGSMLVAGDGGIFKMTTGPIVPGSFATCDDGAFTFSDAAFLSLDNGYAVTQFNSGAVYPDDTAYLGGTQTTGTVRGADASGPEGWVKLSPGFGGFAGGVALDPVDPNVIYVANGWWGLVSKSVDGGATFWVSPHPFGITGGGFVPQAPFVMDPTDSRRLWIGGDSLFRTDDGAEHWTAASAVLASSASAIAIASSNPDFVLAGTRAGAIYRTSTALSATASTVWASVTPRAGWVSSLAIDPVSPNVAYATYSTFGGIHVYKSTNSGASWTKADGTGATGIPDVPVLSLAIDPTNTSRLYVGTDVGVFVSVNGGTTWAKENTGFANAVTEALVVNGANLYAFTHGRGAWRVPLTGGGPIARLDFDSIRTILTEESTVLNLSVTLSTSDHAPVQNVVNVAYNTSNGTATAGNDYTGVSDVLTFPAGSPHGTKQTISVAVLEDGQGEARETFTVNLANSAGTAFLGRRTHTVVIDDDGDPPGLAIGDVTVAEASTTATFTVSVYPAVPGAAVTVNYATVDGSATAGATGDYTAAAGVVTLPAGTTSKTFTVPLRPDTVAEPSETFFVNLSNPVGAPLADAQAVATIVEDDVAGILELSAPTFTVLESGTRATITVKRTEGAASGVTIQYLTSNGTATAPDDYTPTTGTLTFGANVSSLTFTIPITNDTLDENDETVNLQVLNPGGFGAILGPQSTAVLTITDNDVGGTLAFSGDTYAGAEGTSVLVTVRRAGGAASGVTVKYATSNGSAVEPGDYTATSGILTFGASETEKKFSVSLAAENPIVVEGDETVNLTLSDPAGGAVLGTPATAVLVVQDVSPKLAFSAASVTASEKSASIVLTVKRIGPPGTTIRAKYTTADGTATANPVGTNPADYATVSSVVELVGTATSKTITIPLKVDTLVEGPESFSVTLSDPEGGQLGAIPTTTVNITDDDFGGAFEFSAAAVSVNEPPTPPGSTPIKTTLTVKRTGGVASGVTVDWGTVNGSATAPGDYKAAAGTLTFTAGLTSKTVIVEVEPDDEVEGYETFKVTLSTPTGGGTLGTRKEEIVTIVDSEPVVQFSAPTYSVTEGTPKATFTLKRTGTKTDELTVSLIALVDGTATGGAGGDYNNVPADVVIPKNAVSKTFTVDILQDALLEPTETLRLQLTSCSPGCTVGPVAIGELAIKDDEPVVSFSAATYTVGEATPKVTLTLKRIGSKADPLKVNLMVAGGTATGGGVDYNNLPVTVEILKNVTSKPFTIDIVNDLLGEANETLQLQITDVVGGFVGSPATTVVTITDNEPAIAWSASTYTATEPSNTATTPTLLTITVKRTGILTQVSTVDYAVAAVTATEGVDYTLTPPILATGTITFPLKASSVTFQIAVLHDTIDEPNETINLSLSNPTGAKLGTTVEATVTIKDND